MDSFENSNENTLFLEMRARFPNLSDEKINQTIRKVSGNRDTCYKVLFHENNLSRQSSTQNIPFPQNSVTSSSRTESRFFPANQGSSESVFSQSIWRPPNPNMGRQTSYPSYAYNGGPSSFQPPHVQSAPVGANNKDTFFISYNSQIARSQTNPYNHESSYESNQPPPYPGSGGPRTLFESNTYGSPTLNSPTRHISTLQIDPAPPYAPSQFQFYTQTVGGGAPGSSSSHSPSMRNSPQPNLEGASVVNFKVTPNKDSRPLFQFSATPGHRSYPPRSPEENNQFRISISTSERDEMTPGSNRYQLFPEHHQERPSNYQYQQIPPRPTPTSSSSYMKNYPSTVSSAQKNQIGMNSNDNPSANSKDQHIKPTFYKSTLHSPSLGPITKPYPTNPGEEDDYNRVLIAHQKAGLNLLRKELLSSKGELTDLKLEVYSKEGELIDSQRNKYVNPDEMQKLREEITLLRVECHCLSVEVDRQVNSQVPLGVTDADFYNNIFTGQPGSNISGSIIGQVAQSAGAIAAAIPTATQGGVEGINAMPSHHQHPAAEEDDEEKIKWNCPKCTYLNHPDLNVCELCETERPPYAVDSM